jgi:DnaK suppressor protein
MLTNEKRAYFRRVLEGNLDILLKNGSDREALTYYFKDGNADPLDKATEELHASLGFRFRERDSNLIRKIREALKRIDDETFGICDQCGRKISEKRLQVRPIATLCIKCKEKQEGFERLFGT